MKGDRVQDKDGFTGTVSDDTDVDKFCEIEVVWDISGCASMVSINDNKEMERGQDDKRLQNEIWRGIYGDDD